MARSGQLMEIRNACLYSDLNLIASTASCPEDVITAEYAYYFICMAFEIIAEQSSSGFGNCFESSNPDTSSFWKGLASDLNEFIKGKTSDIDILKLLEQAIKDYPSVVDTEKIDKSMEFSQDHLKDLENFVKCWAGTADIDGLEFLAYPEPLRKEARKRDQK